MAYDALTRLARRHGVGTSYEDWRGRRAEVPRDTIVAVLAALGVDATAPAAVRTVERPKPPPPPIRPPEGRVWGLAAQLYSVRSRRSWGLGDLRDLADLASWAGGRLGAGFVLVNPMHAGEPAPPIEPSPYSPASRRYASPLYLRVEDVPEHGNLDAAGRAEIAALAAPLREASALDRDAASAPLDRDGAWRAKRAALEMLFTLPRTAARQESYERFRRREGEALTAFATWCALAEDHGADGRGWPVGLRDAGGPAVPAERRRLRRRVEFHRWLQWLLDEQLAAAQRAARDAGMPIGIVHDLAVGVRHGGADTWADPSAYAPCMSVGAPPDEFNQRGQDWGQPPWHPGRLAAAGYEPFRATLAAALRHGGGLRVDHAMQVSRLWWIPEGASPAEGTYVSYDRTAMLGVIAEEARRHRALVIGEDLGTVEPGLRADLAGAGVLGTSMLWFERERDGRPRRPERWRAASLATVGTHDMPPIAGYLHGDHIAPRERLGLLARPAAEELAAHREALRGWLALLHDLGLLAASPDEVTAAVRAGERHLDGAVTAALHALLARTPALLVGISLADAVGERRTQNQPGTVAGHPNWRIPLAGPDGRPILLEDLPGDPALRAALAPVRAALSPGR